MDSFREILSRSSGSGGFFYREILSNIEALDSFREILSNNNNNGFGKFFLLSYDQNNHYDTSPVHTTFEDMILRNTI